MALCAGVAVLEVFMEGKPGILVVLVVLNVLLIVAAAVFGVLFAIKQTIIFADYNINLYFAIGCFGFFIISSAATIAARNARITADNTYDILRHLELLVKKEGISLSDLALRDQKTAAKIAKKLEGDKLKAEKAEAEKEAAKAKERLALEEAARETEAATAAAAAAAAEAEQSAAETATEEAPVSESEPAESEEAAEVEEVLQDVNCGIEYTEWKAALEGKLTCGECGSPVKVAQTKTKVVVLLCQGVKDGNGCSQSKPIPVKTLADQFLDWFDAFFGEKPEYFSLTDFNAKVENVSIKDKVCTFTAKVSE